MMDQFLKVEEPKDIGVLNAEHLGEKPEASTLTSLLRARGSRSA